MPSGFLRRQFDDGAAAADIEALLISQVDLAGRAKRGEEKFKRVAAGSMCGFVKET